MSVRSAAHSRLQVAGVGVYGDAEARALAPDRDVRPMVSGPDGRQVVGEAPFGVEVALGRWFRTSAPPVVDEPECERDGRRLETVVGLMAATADQTGQVRLAEPDGESARSEWVVPGRRLDAYLELAHYRNPYRSRQEPSQGRSIRTPARALDTRETGLRPSALDMKRPASITRSRSTPVSIPQPCSM